MFEKYKLSKDHQILIDGLAEECKQDRNSVLSDVVEMGFVMIRLATENDDKIKEGYDYMKADENFMKRAKLLREWWEAGNLENQTK